jgi:16S rRNA (guanine966-N2)-methyltransferase
VRVVAGELGGRRLRAPRGDAVRPTSDRVREALFSILGDVAGLRALDLFCGTGALGIEALSRGAVHATFVDLDTGAVERNLEELGLRDRAELRRSDAVAYLAAPGPSFDLVLCDPPYGEAAGLGRLLDAPLVRRIGEDARVIVETAAGEPVELPSHPLLDERVYGGTLIRIHGARR